MIAEPIKEDKRFPLDFDILFYGQSRAAVKGNARREGQSGSEVNNRRALDRVFPWIRFFVALMDQMRRFFWL